MQGSRNMRGTEFQFTPFSVLYLKAFKADRIFGHFLQIELRGKVTDCTDWPTRSTPTACSKFSSITFPVPVKPGLTPGLQCVVLPGSALADFTDWSQVSLQLWNSFQTPDMNIMCWLTARYVTHRTIMPRKYKNVDLFLNLFLFNTL